MFLSNDRLCKGCRIKNTIDEALQKQMYRSVLGIDADCVKLIRLYLLKRIGVVPIRYVRISSLCELGLRHDRKSVV